MVPADIRDRMPAEELRHRAQYVHHLTESSPLTGEGRDLAMAHGQSVLRALPVRELIEQVKAHNDRALELPHGGGVDSPAADMRAAAQKLREKNHYPPGLVRACEDRLQGKQPSYDGCDIGQVLGIGPAAKAAKAARPKVGSSGDGNQDSRSQPSKPRTAPLGSGFCQFCGEITPAKDHHKGGPHWAGTCQKPSGPDLAKLAKASLDQRIAALVQEIQDMKARLDRVGTSR
jgi:hypothetical protein